MKIVYIIPSLRRGGAERLVLDICNCLYQRPEVEFKLVCFTEENDYTELTYYNYLVVIPSSIQISVYKKNKFNVQTLNSFIKNFKPDIIHTHLFEAEIISRSCYYPNALWFTHCHDNMIQFRNFSIQTLFKKKLLTNYYEKLYLKKQYLINGSNYFITISEDNYNYFLKVMPNYQLTLLHNGFDYKKFYTENRNVDYYRELQIINVGTLSGIKNQHFLIRVAKALYDKKLPFKLILVGDGSVREELEVTIKNLGVEEKVNIIGFVRNVEDYFKQADIYVHSSKSEAFGLTLIEAMAAGLPVITLDGKGNRDLIEQGKNGYMIYEQNPELFAETIINLWHDRKKYNEISKYAQEYAKKFDIGFYVDSLLDLYKKAIKEKNNKS